MALRVPSSICSYQPSLSSFSADSCDPFHTSFCLSNCEQNSSLRRTGIASVPSNFLGNFLPCHESFLLSYPPSTFASPLASPRLIFFSMKLARVYFPCESLCVAISLTCSLNLPAISSHTRLKLTRSTSGTLLPLSCTVR